MARPATVLITGASSGIGRALAFEYAAGGARVALAARRIDELAITLQGVRDRGGSGICIPLDVTDPMAVREAVERADRELGSLDMVVANAGFGSQQHASRLQWGDVAPMIRTNVDGAMATLLAAVPVMMARASGHLVAITSLAGRRALPGSAAYCASKAAVSVFLESLRIDLARAGIRVTDVQPGFVATAATANAAHPMPLVWSADRAARHIVRRLEKAPAIVAFPWPLAVMTTMGRYIPAWLYDRIVRMAAA
jgi:NADP-dependent 3-hydroxy acid dehydrogenase YdfG